MDEVNALKEECTKLIWAWISDNNANDKHYAVICGLIASNEECIGSPQPMYKIDQIHTIFMINACTDIEKLKRVKQYIETPQDDCVIF